MSCQLKDAGPATGAARCRRRCPRASAPRRRRPSHAARCEARSGRCRRRYRSSSFPSCCSRRSRNCPRHSTSRRRRESPDCSGRSRRRWRSCPPCRAGRPGSSRQTGSSGERRPGQAAIDREHDGFSRPPAESRGGGDRGEKLTGIGRRDRQRDPTRCSWRRDWRPLSAAGDEVARRGRRSCRVVDRSCRCRSIAR